jgi:hypothetical protein
MTWSKKHFTVFGLSKEGYDMASKFSEKGFETSIIDERLNSPMKLNRRDFSKNRTVDEFFDEETLTEIASLQDTISHSDILIYCPKIRCEVTEIYHQYERSLKEIIPILSKGSTLIFSVPLGFEGQKEMIKMARKYADPNERGYGILFLPPFFDGKANVVGTFGNVESTLEALCEALGQNVHKSTLEEAEKIFFSKILERYAYFTSKMVTSTTLNNYEEEHPYCDDLFSYYTDLKMIYTTAGRGTQLKSFSSSLIRIVDSYPKNLLNYLKVLTKENNVKPSRARIIALWSRSRYHIRPDVEKAAQDLIMLVQDIFVDVQILSYRELIQKKILSATLNRNPTFVISCSDFDYQNVAAQLKGKNQMVTVIKATLPPSR